MNHTGNGLRSPSQLGRVLTFALVSGVLLSLAFAFEAAETCSQ
jgi:hypothetical protein